MNAGSARRALRGLYAITPDTDDTQRLLTQVAAAISGGGNFVQYRNKTAGAALRLEQARALKSLCAERGATLIINDHVDIALAVDAEGVHLGAEDGSLPRARQVLGPGKLIGVSCYNQMELARAAATSDADYVAFGSFFPSRVKPGAVHAPLSLLDTAKRELEVPVAAIGGITLEHAPQLISRGADLLAVITAVFDADDVTAAARRFSDLFESRS